MRLMTGDKVVVVGDVPGIIKGTIATVFAEYDEPTGHMYELRSGEKTVEADKPFKGLKFKASDLSLYGVSTMQQIDFQRYLTSNQMFEIASKIYAEKVEEEIDRLMKDRSIGIPSVLARIFEKLVEKYVVEYGPEFKTDFLQIAREEINRTEPIDENFYMFRQSFVHHLGNIAYQYADENKEFVQGLMKDQIHHIIRNTVSDDICGKLNRVLQPLIRGTIIEVLREYDGE